MGAENQLCVLEYSPSQKAFHIEPFQEFMVNNLKGFIQGHLTDYVPLAASTNRDDLDKIAKCLKGDNDERRMGKTA